MARRKVIRSPRSVRKERVQKNKKIFWLALLFLAVLGGVLYGFSRPEFRITEVEVIGSKRVSEDLVREKVQQELVRTFLGFIPKSHSLLYPKTSIQDALVKEFPAFSRVSLSLRNLSTLRVFVYEREPLALWCDPKEECFLIDETGFIFAPADFGTEHMYYRIEGGVGTETLRDVAISKEKLSKLLSFLKRLEDVNLQPETVLQKEQGELEVLLHGGTRLLLREDGYEKAFISLETLISQHALPVKGSGDLSAAYVDLRYGNKIYFKPR